MTATLRKLGFATFALSLSAISANAQDVGSAQDAKAMLDRAVAALKSNEAAALKEFNDPGNKRFRDRDLFVFCFDVASGAITAYSSPGLLGVDLRSLSLKDDPVGQRVYDAVRTLPEESVATVDYSFPKPGTTDPVPKQSLEARVGDQGCGIAYYK
jgi:hypothetical protein